MSGMTAPSAITNLRRMQSQIVHGSNIFGEIADCIEDLQKTLLNRELSLKSEGDRWVKAMTRQDKLTDALRRIGTYPVHSEPVGSAMAMQEIAQDALKSLTT